MGTTRLRASGLSKAYRLGEKAEPYSSLRDVLAALPRRLLRAGRRTDPFWALRGVSFEISEGEVVGIVGRNGAGKSTLLKILARITEPTEGEATIAGRVGSLLEVGTGFHPELTGRENVYLNGAILGMRRAEIDRRFDEIVAFAEVEPFLETPVKHYSSGMYLRLAFAVAAHLEPEILLVDEVLAVGDAAFQKKCLGRMSEVSHEGRTILFVSHNLVALQALCSRAIWIHDGEVRADGEPSEVIAGYLAAVSDDAREREWTDPDNAPGNDMVRLRSVRIRATSGQDSIPITVRTPFDLEFEYWNLAPGARLNLSLLVTNQQGVTVFNTFPQMGHPWYGAAFPAGLFRSTCRIPGHFLNEGLYRVELLVVKDQGLIVYRHEDVVTFEVADDPERGVEWYGRWLGVTRPRLDWRTEQMPAPTAQPRTVSA